MPDLDVTANGDGSYRVLIDYDGTVTTPTLIVDFVVDGDEVVLTQEGTEDEGRYSLADRFGGELTEASVKQFLISGGA